MIVQLPITVPFFDFQPMDWNAFQATYRKDIRVNWEPEGLKKPKTGIHLADEDTEIYVPHYKKGGWRYGTPQQVPLGTSLKLVRIPAVRFKNRYMILDGYHRVTQLSPRIILLDYVEVKEQERKYITDLISDWWENV